MAHQDGKYGMGTSEVIAKNVEKIFLEIIDEDLEKRKTALFAF